MVKGKRIDNVVTVGGSKQTPTSTQRSHCFTNLWHKDLNKSEGTTEAAEMVRRVKTSTSLHLFLDKKHILYIHISQRFRQRSSEWLIYGCNVNSLPKSEGECWKSLLGLKILFHSMNNAVEVCNITSLHKDKHFFFCVCEKRMVIRLIWVPVYHAMTQWCIIGRKRVSILAFMPTCYQGLSRVVSQLPFARRSSPFEFQVNMRFGNTKY